MASNQEWANAYLEQAKEDLKAATIIPLKEAPSVFCMLMQMTFEKTAKSALIKKGQMSLKKAKGSHAAASKLIEFLKTHQNYLSLANMGKTYMWNDILPLVRQLERAQPSEAKKDKMMTFQLEYPWEESSNKEIRWPAKHFPLNTQLQANVNTIPRLVKFASVLILDIEQGL